MSSRIQCAGCGAQVPAADASFTDAGQLACAGCAGRLQARAADETIAWHAEQEASRRGDLNVRLIVAGVKIFLLLIAALFYAATR